MVTYIGTFAVDGAKSAEFPGRTVCDVGIADTFARCDGAPIMQRRLQ